MLQYLGSTVVTVLEGTESTKASISQLKVVCIILFITTYSEL